MLRDSSDGSQLEDREHAADGLQNDCVEPKSLIRAHKLTKTQK